MGNSKTQKNLKRKTQNAERQTTGNQPINNDFSHSTFIVHPFQGPMIFYSAEISFLSFPNISKERKNEKRVTPAWVSKVSSESMEPNIIR